MLTSEQKFPIKETAQHLIAEVPRRSLPEMYGPPQDCKGKFGREDKSAQMYSSIRAKMLSSAKISCRCCEATLWAKG